MNLKLEALAVGLAAMVMAHAAAAQDNVVKFGLTEYTTHSSTNGISGIGVPPGADADVGNATTVIFIYERMLTPNIGAEFVLGVPPKIEAMNYHFGNPGDTWRPYLGAGINYTKFVQINSILASDVQMSDSWGWAAQAGIDYAMSKEWSLFASVAALKVKSKLVATGATVLETTIDFRPIVYSFGVVYRF
jgi:outer membrane protein